MLVKIIILLQTECGAVFELPLHLAPGLLAALHSRSTRITGCSYRGECSKMHTCRAAERRWDAGSEEAASWMPPRAVLRDRFCRLSSSARLARRRARLLPSALHSSSSAVCRYSGSSTWPSVALAIRSSTLAGTCLCELWRYVLLGSRIASR